MVSISKLISTFFYIGLFPKAPGTIASFVTVLFWVLFNSFNIKLYFVIIVLILFSLSFYFVDEYLLDNDNKDPKEVVIDEVVGQWIAVLPLALFPLNSGSSYALWFMALIIFRLLDITKPGLIGWADRKNTPISVMLDDLIAGAMTAAIIYLIFILLKWI